MKAVSNICRLLSHNALQNISNQACFGINTGQRRCIGRLVDKSVNSKGKTGALLCFKTGCWFSVMEKIIPNTCYIPIRLAGHSHYDNIKDIKAKFDKQKSTARAQFIPKILQAIRVGGSTKPANNSALERVLKEGRKQNIPVSTMEKVLKREEERLQGNRSNDLNVIELVISGGVGIIVVGPDLKRMKMQVNTSLRKFPEVKKGNCLKMFDKKGNVLVMLGKDEKEVDLDKYLDIGIEVGAEDVELEKDSEDEKTLKFICEPTHVSRIERELSSKGLEVLIAETVYEPIIFAEVDQEQMDYIERIIDRLNDSDDIVNVFINTVLAD